MRRKEGTKEGKKEERKERRTDEEGSKRIDIEL